MAYIEADFSSNQDFSSEWTTKLEKLDDLFLFTISIVGLLFAVIQVLTIGLTGLIEISPILLLGVGLPVYVGYVRGAIEFGNSVTERERGWVYLIIGITAFIAFFLLRYGVVGIMFYSFFLLLALIFCNILEKWFNRYFLTRQNINNLYAFSGTMVAGISLAYFLAYTVSLYLTYITDFQFSSLTLALINLAVITLVIFVVLEVTSRRLVGLSLPINKRQAQKRHRTFFFFKVVLCSLELFLLAIKQGTRIVYAFVAGLVFYLSSIVALVFLLIFQDGLAQVVYGVFSVISIACLLLVAFFVARIRKLGTERFVLWFKEKETLEKIVEEAL